MHPSSDLFSAGRIRKHRLTLALAASAAVGMALYGVAILGLDDEEGQIVTLLVASGAGICGAITGLVLRRPGSRDNGWLLLPLVNMGLGGVLAASFLLLVWGDLHLALIYVFCGVFLAIMPLPVMGIVYAAERRVGRARPGSLLDTWDRRRVWFAVFAGIAASAWFSGVMMSEREPLVIFVLCCSVGALSSLWYVDRDLRKELRRVADETEERTNDPTLVGREVLDLGIGEERWRCAPEVELSYRSAKKPGLVIHGWLLETLRWVERGVLFDGFAVLLALAGVLHLALRPLADEESALPPPASQPEPEPPGSRPSALGWYPNQTPIVVDLNADGVEDVIGLRWDNARPETALSVAANDGATRLPLWETPRIASQWASPRMNLVQSGKTLFLTDSERKLHILDLESGKSSVPPQELAEVSHVCPFGDLERAVWIRDHADYSRQDEGLRVGADGARSKARRPLLCQGRSDPARYDPRCSVPLARKKPKLRLGWLHDFQGHGVALAAGASAERMGTLLVGYRFSKCEPTWEAALAFTPEPLHDDSQLKIEVTEDRIYAVYQLRDGRWYIGARDARTGALLWHHEPPRAHYGTHLQTLSASSERLYLGVNWRLELFDPTDGQSLGVIW
jgi:hypothetical protein